MGDNVSCTGGSSLKLSLQAVVSIVKGYSNKLSEYNYLNTICMPIRICIGAYA